MISPKISAAAANCCGVKSWSRNTTTAFSTNSRYSSRFWASSSGWVRSTPVISAASVSVSGFTCIAMASAPSHIFEAKDQRSTATTDKIGRRHGRGQAAALNRSGNHTKALVVVGRHVVDERDLPGEVFAHRFLPVLAALACQKHDV